MALIEIEGLSKTYGDCKAVDGISFSVEKGALIGFLGVNGAGKSTTINMMSTLLRPTAGRIAICGYDAASHSTEIRRRIGIVYQNNVLDELLTVRENLLCRGILHGAGSTQARKRAEELCEVFSLGELMKKKYRTLSGGQKRRCEIAAALMHTPELLILDEPTTGLDPAARQEVWATVEQLRHETDMTVFLTTHYMEEAAEADRIIVIHKGRIIAQGLPHELKEQYAADYLRIYCDAAQKTALREKLSGTECLDEPYGLRVMLRGTKAALPLLDRIGTDFAGFEVVQGTMDDVFLNVTKEAE